MKKTKSELDQLLLNAFNDYYPVDQRVSWFDDYAHFLTFYDKQKKVVQLTVYFEEGLKLNEHLYWEENNGQKNLVQIDAQTGKKSIVIQYEYPMYVLFIAHLHSSLDVEVVEQLPLSDMEKLKESSFVKKGAY